MATYFRTSPKLALKEKALCVAFSALVTLNLSVTSQTCEIDDALESWYSPMPSNVFAWSN